MTEKRVVHGKVFKPYLSAAEIDMAIQKMARLINQEYAGKNPLCIGILNGSFMFASDLFKYLEVEPEICFIKLASYQGMQSSGEVITSIGLDKDLTGRHVIVLEDIVDTGKTLFHFLPQLEAKQPASLKLAALLHKPTATVHPLTIDFLGITVPDRFLIGYGLDFDGLGRNFPAIYQLEE